MINVFNLNKKRRIRLSGIKKIARYVLKKINKKRKIDLNLIFVKDAHIRKLNKKYKHINRATDVLCFSISEKKSDIFISSDKAAFNSKRYRTNFKDELNLYVIHGVLHTLGFNDETKTERKKMEKVQKALLFQVRARKGL